MTKTEKENLQAIIDGANDARGKLHEIEAAERDASNKKRVGEYYKFRNRYSSDDSWWLYGKVISASGGVLYMFQFQTDCYDKIDVEPRDSHYYNLDGWVKISKSEFLSAWRAVLKRLNSPKSLEVTKGN